jgi:hypothetical protein
MINKIKLPARKLLFTGQILRSLARIYLSDKVVIKQSAGI